jgi:hypothetical protein
VKTIEQHFADWESDTFGYGYGSGEKPILSALKSFLFACPPSGCYDSNKLEGACGASIAWLLITALIRDDKIEYGTSPRWGWLTDSGKALAKFVEEHSVEELEVIAYGTEDEIPCYPGHCNCDDGDCRPSNPFWEKRLRT